MDLTPSFFQHAAAQGGRLAAYVLSRDNLHLAPEMITRAAARRLGQGIRALEAYLRRLLILLALTLEPGLKPDQTERAVRYGSRSKFRAKAFRIFTGEHDFPDLFHTQSPKSGADRMASAAPILASPLLQRLSQLKALIDAPQARARRLAFCLARRRSGLLFAPGLAHALPYRYGTEISMLYTGFAQAIQNLSRARPPPIGPVPRPPPRIRRL